MSSKREAQQLRTAVHVNFAGANPVLVRRLFSSRVLKELGSGELPKELVIVLRSLEGTGQLAEGMTLSDLYESAFKFCLKNQRVEYFYKNALVQKLVLGRHSLSTATACLEVRIAEAKLDVLLAREYLSAYEIKTDYDELARLSTQLNSYQKACRQVSVVTSERYAPIVERLISPEIGLLVLTGRYQLRVIRPAETFDSLLSHTDMLALLRRKDLLDLLCKLGRDGERIPNTKIYQEALSASLAMDPVAINAFVAKRLLARSAPKKALVSGLPASLAASALAQDLTGVQIARLIDLFEMDVTRGIRCELSSLFSW